jgi:hypothetical protein
MMLFEEPLLIETAPDHILVGLGIFFALTAATLLCQAVEQGVYPELRECLAGLPQRLVRHRQLKQRWAYYTFGGQRCTASP